jgi:hypothetical protein
MSDRFAVALEALTKTRLNADQRVEALKAMHEAGLLDSPRAVHAAASAPARETVTLLQAASAPNNRIRLNRIMAECRRLGHELQIDDEGKVDMRALDRDLRGKDVARRVSIKANLHAMGLCA